MTVVKRIPAGKYEGMYRARLGERGGVGRTHNSEESYKMKHVVCGLCGGRYRAFKANCSNCGGV